MYRLELEIRDILPKSLNKEFRTNRFMRNNQNKRWDALIDSLVRHQLPPIPLTKARIEIVRHSYRMLDFDGLVGSMKPIVDALVTAQVLADDKWSITGQWHVTQAFRPKKNGSLIEVKIAEV